MSGERAARPLVEAANTSERPVSLSVSAESQSGLFAVTTR